MALFRRRPPERVEGLVIAGVRKPAHFETLDRQAFEWSRDSSNSSEPEIEARAARDAVVYCYAGAMRLDDLHDDREAKSKLRLPHTSSQRGIRAQWRAPFGLHVALARSPDRVMLLKVSAVLTRSRA